jgi:exopolyphosphatase/guanosine-5'-triphosphate,3'-diphosphate pyrophosphatase
MDIKALQQVNADGLEQWKPVMKAGFPLSAADARKVFEALQIAAPPLARAAYTLEQLIDELGKPPRRVRTVAVHKKRARYRVDECAAEITEVAASGKSVRTVAIESEDPSRVIAAVRGLGLGRFENVSYPKGLKRLVGMVS